MPQDQVSTERTAGNHPALDVRMKAMLAVLAIFPVVMQLSPPAAAFDPAEAEHLLSGMLNLPLKRHRIEKSDGTFMQDGLKDYNEMAEMYQRYKSDVMDSDDNINALKHFMFLGYFYSTTNYSALQESFRTDLLTIFLANHDKVVEITNELPYLAPVILTNINEYFEIAPESAIAESDFVEQFSSELSHLETMRSLFLQRSRASSQ